MSTKLDEKPFETGTCIGDGRLSQPGKEEAQEVLGAALLAKKPVVNFGAGCPCSVRQSGNQFRSQMLELPLGRLIVLKSDLPQVIAPGGRIAVPRHVHVLGLHSGHLALMPGERKSM